MVGIRQIFALTALIALALTAPSYSQDAQKTNDAVDVAAKVATDPPPSVGELIDEKIQDFIDKSGFGARERRGELFVLHGTAPINLPASNPDWVKAREIAYADALIEAQAAFVAERFTFQTTNTVKDFYKAGTDEPPPYIDGRSTNGAVTVLRKLLGVVNGKLDKQLLDMGIDPKEYAKAPEPQKTALLTNHLKIQNIKKSFGDMIGLLPVMTFEANDGAHNFRVGVVAVVSSSMKDFAKQVLSAQGGFQPNSERAQDLTKLYADKKQLLSDFGVRRLYDERGLPVIVSFAQWGSSYSGTDAAMAATYEDAARRQAEAVADGQISDFLAANVAYSDTSEVGQEQDRIASSLPDTVSTAETVKIVDALTRTIKRTSSAKITGLHTLYQWTGRHPASKTPIIGVIRIWSASAEQAIRGLDSPKKADDAASPSATKGTPGVTQGRQLMNKDDF